jgi:hypothetical protein
LILVVFIGCTKTDFDGFDPVTSTLKWIITKDKNDKKSSD